MTLKNEAGFVEASILFNKMDFPSDKKTVISDHIVQ